MPRRGPEPRRVKIVRYVDGQGRRCRKGDPGAARKVERSETYYAHLPDPGGGRPLRVSLGTTDLGAAWVELRRLQRQAAERAAGISDPYLGQARRPIGEHLGEWRAAVLAKGTTRKQADTLHNNVRRLAELAGWARLGDVSASSCLHALARLGAEPGSGTSKARGGRSAQTRNHYLSHAKQFVRWCAQERRLRDDPLAGLRKASVESDRRHDRRCPADDEVDALFAHLAGPAAPERCGMSGARRALGYKVALATGYRAGELRSLTPESFVLDPASGTLSVAVRAAYSKRRRRDAQQLPSWLAGEVRAWLAAHAAEPGGGLWEAFPEVHPGRLLEDDLAAARAEWLAAAPDASERARREASGFLRYETAGPDGQLFWDFHALRVWYITQIAGQPGMDLKTLLTLTRHSAPHLSLNVYAKSRQESVRAAVERLPRIGGAAGTPIPPGPPAGLAPGG